MQVVYASWASEDSMTVVICSCTLCSACGTLQIFTTVCLSGHAWRISMGWLDACFGVGGGARVSMLESDGPWLEPFGAKTRPTQMQDKLSRYSVLHCSERKQLALLCLERPWGHHARRQST